MNELLCEKAKIDKIPRWKVFRDLYTQWCCPFGGICRRKFDIDMSWESCGEIPECYAQDYGQWCLIEMGHLIESDYFDVVRCFVGNRSHEGPQISRAWSECFFWTLLPSENQGKRILSASIVFLKRLLATTNNLNNIIWDLTSFILNRRQKPLSPLITWFVSLSERANSNARTSSISKSPATPTPSVNDLGILTTRHIIHPSTHHV